MNLNQNANIPEVIDDISVINRLSENVFTVRDSIDGVDFEVDLYHSALTPTFQFWVKEYFVQMCGGWNHTELQTLSSRKNTAKNWKAALLRIGVWASTKYPSLPLSQWTELHVKALLLDILDNKINWTEDNEKAPLSRGVIDPTFLILKRSRNLKLKGLLSDGIAFDFPKSFLKTSLKTKLKSYGFSYDEWYKGQGWSSIPLTIAMAFLHDAIAILQDKKTIFLKDYFKYQRGTHSYSVNQIFKGNFDRYLKGEWVVVNTFTKTQLDGLKDIKEKHYGNNIVGLPFSDLKQFNEHCNEVYDACIVIFLCLTGIRLSELGSICGDDYYIENDGTWVFKSELIKTNYGITEVREMHGLVAEAASTLVALSYIDKRNRKDKERLPLFGKYFSKKDYKNNDDFRRENRRASDNTLRYRLNSIYSKFLQCHPEFNEHCPSIHPHRFRHTWAEFALRRFEGNVFEAIRRHFRHSYGSYFTTHYVFGKLKDEVRDEIEKQYLKEILTKLATENVQAVMDDDLKRDLHGKVAHYISKSMGTIVLTETEIDDFVDDMAEEFESITAHEYGYCLVRKEMKHLAKCIDKKTQTPMLDTGVFEVCSDCINFLTSENANKESITRIAVSHQHMIARFTNLMGDNVKSIAIDTSRQTLKRAEAMLDEMDT